MKWTNLSGVAKLLSVALLAVSCRDATRSVRPSSEAPVFAAVPGPPVLDQRNGTLGFNGTDIRKGFNPHNPQTGDAIIATFIWQGSTNVITSVIDHLTDGTPVGNTYNLVEYKTAGGVSMATYVALNVQNFPAGDPSNPNPDQNKVLVVTGTLSQPITQGGIMISAYRGVATVAALTGHASAGGTSNTTTAASTGPITPGDGALVYSASMSSPNGPVDPPAGFNEVNFLSSADNVMKLLGQWKVHSGSGPIDPTWSWYFSQPSSWLLTNIALLPNGGGPPPTTGDLTATTSTSGTDLDPDGYMVTVDGGAARQIGINGSVTYNGLPSGDHSVALSGVAANCTVGGSNPRTISVPAGGAVSTAFSVTCATTPPPTGSLTVNASTSGGNLDPDGYTVTVDGGTSQVVSVNGSVTFDGLTEGNHTVSLSGVAGNCTLAGANPRSVFVAAGGTASTTYSVSCTSPNQAPVVNAGADESAVVGFLYSLKWSFTDPDNGPWSFTIDWGDGTFSAGTKSSAGSFSNEHTYFTLLPKTYTVRVTVTDSAGGTHSVTKKVTVLLL